MYVYLICCNMKHSYKKFKSLENIIKECAFEDTWMYYIDSTWIIKSNMTADEIGGRIAALTEGAENFMVIQVSNNFACWLPQTGLDYLNSRIFVQ